MIFINIEDIDIPIINDTLSLKGSIYYGLKTPKKAPFIINISGMGNNRNSSFVYYFSEKFAEAGYYVLSYDHRGHGKTEKLTKRVINDNIVKIFYDIHHVITWIINQQKELVFEYKNRFIKLIIYVLKK